MPGYIIPVTFKKAKYWGKAVGNALLANAAFQAELVKVQAELQK